MSKNLYAGLLFALVGGVVLMSSTNYAFGTLLRMGPGFFPAIIGGLTLLVGVLLIIKGVGSGTAEPLPLFLRPVVFITLSVIVFSLTLQGLGLVIATFLLVFIAHFADRSGSITSTIKLCLVLVPASILIFWYFLALPIRILPT